MAFDYELLTEITTVPSTVGAIFTNPASTKTFIRNIHLHNSNSSPETVYLYKVPNDGGAVGTAGETNEIYQVALSAGQSADISIEIPGRILESENDTIQTVTDTASKVTIEISGGQE